MNVVVIGASGRRMRTSLGRFRDRLVAFLLDTAARFDPSVLQGPGGVLLALLSTAVAVVSYRYVAKLGFVPPNVAANRCFRPWIVVHAGAASTALLLGPLQLLSGVQRNWPRLHRSSGWAYVLGCLGGGVSGLVLAQAVSTGPIAAAGFGALATLWLYTTTRGLLAALARDFARHRRWMIRSLALTFAAVTLRLYLPLSSVLHLDFVVAYRAIAWLAWVPNACIAEWYLSRGRTVLAGRSNPSRTSPALAHSWADAVVGASPGNTTHSEDQHGKTAI